MKNITQLRITNFKSAWQASATAIKQIVEAEDLTKWKQKQLCVWKRGRNKHTHKKHLEIFPPFKQPIQTCHQTHFLHPRCLRDIDGRGVGDFVGARPGSLGVDTLIYGQWCLAALRDKTFRLGLARPIRCHLKTQKFQSPRQALNQIRRMLIHLNLPQRVEEEAGFKH